MRTSDAVTSFIVSRRAKGLSPQTLRWYQGILDKFSARYKILPTKPEQVELFLVNCTIGDERRHGYFRCLRAFYRFLERRRGIINIITLVDAPQKSKKSPRALTPDEIDQLFSYPHKPKIKAALMFLLDTGCRIGELHNLRISDLSETPWGYVAQVNGKTGQRFVPISPEVYRAMIKNLPLGYSLYRLRRVISFAFQDAHVPGTAHTLRHTFGSLFEGDETVLQRIMGHSNISTTQLYRHLRTKYLSEQHRQNTPLKYVLNRTKPML